MPEQNSNPADVNTATEKPLLIFDGVCNLCNAWVDFVIRHDPQARIKFAASSSNIAKKYLHKSDNGDIFQNTVLLIDQGKQYERSDAVLKLIPHLGGIFWLLLPGYLLPRFIRNGIYDFIARNRYSWFGKRTQCRIPGPADRERFLDDESS